MANQDHLDILNQGVETWNQWRAEHPDIHPELWQTNLNKFYLRGVNFSKVNLVQTELIGAELSEAGLVETMLVGADLSGANLAGANLSRANLGYANLSHANLTGAYLGEAIFVGTNFSHATLTECHVHGVSIWNAQLEGAKQENLIITRHDEPAITVDNIEIGVCPQLEQKVGIGK